MGDREPNRTTSGTLQPVLSQSSIFGQNPKIGCQEFNDLQTPELSKKQLCDRTQGTPAALPSPHPALPGQHQPPSRCTALRLVVGRAGGRLQRAREVWLG